jgi:hypothetical protein
MLKQSIRGLKSYEAADDWSATGLRLGIDPEHDLLLAKGGAVCPAGDQHPAGLPKVIERAVKEMLSIHVNGKVFTDLIDAINHEPAGSLQLQDRREAVNGELRLWRRPASEGRPGALFCELAREQHFSGVARYRIPHDRG